MNLEHKYSIESNIKKSQEKENREKKKEENKKLIKEKARFRARYVGF